MKTIFTRYFSVVAALLLSFGLHAQPTWQNVKYDLNTYHFTETANGYLFAGSGSLVLKSTTSGANGSWTTVSTMPSPTTSWYKLLGLGNQLFALNGGSGGKGVVVSSDYGATWTRRNNGLGSDTSNVSTFHRLAGNNLLISTSTDKLYLSSNLGTSWTMVKTLSSGESVAMTYVKSPSEIFLTTTDNIYKSTDNGLTWTTLTTTMSGSHQITHIGNELFMSGVDVLYKSTNGGSTWTTVSTTGLPASYTGGALFKSRGDTLYYTIIYPSPYGIYYSADGGATWATANTGITSQPQVFQRNIYLSNSGYMFASPSSSGIFRSTSPVSQNTVGLVENSSSNLQLDVFPNPAAEIVTIKLSGTAPLADNVVRIVSIDGKAIASNLSLNHDRILTLDVSGYSSGVYLIQIINEGAVVGQQRIVKL